MVARLKRGFTFITFPTRERADRVKKLLTSGRVFVREQRRLRMGSEGDTGSGEPSIFQISLTYKKASPPLTVRSGSVPEFNITSFLLLS
jgi:hypothetical protein